MLIARHPIWLFVLEFERFKALAPSRRPFFCTSLTEKKNRKMLIEYFFSVFFIEIDKKKKTLQFSPV